MYPPRPANPFPIPTGVPLGCTGHVVRGTNVKQERPRLLGEALEGCCRREGFATMTRSALPVAPAPPAAGSVVEAVVLGGLLVAVLDLTEVIALFWFARGLPPYRIPQSIAAALLGEDAFDQGGTSVLLGLFLHLVVAFSVVAVYVLASRRFPSLARHYVLGGLLYGLCVYAFMNLIVLPSTALPAALKHFSRLGVLNGLLCHPLLVGLPAAWAAHRHWAATSEEEDPDETESLGHG
jgi:hypothetical protein